MNEEGTTVIGVNPVVRVFRGYSSQVVFRDGELGLLVNYQHASARFCPLKDLEGNRDAITVRDLNRVKAALEAVVMTDIPTGWKSLQKPIRIAPVVKIIEDNPVVVEQGYHVVAVRHSNEIRVLTRTFATAPVKRGSKQERVVVEDKVRRLCDVAGKLSPQQIAEIRTLARGGMISREERAYE